MYTSAILINFLTNILAKCGDAASFIQCTNTSFAPQLSDLTQ